MSDPFVAEVRIVGFNFAPRGWAFCNGQTLPISQNTALFSLLGTTYGGDGRSTFGLPDFQGRVGIQQGQGNGLSLYDLGEASGEETITLLPSELPRHNHNIVTVPDPGDTNVVTDNAIGRSSGASVYSNAAPTTPMNTVMLSSVGNTLPHNNMQPYLTLNYIIAMQGIFPPRG
ncbi:MAG: tail fiber protein [Bacteroidota bacterium]